MKKLTAVEEVRTKVEAILAKANSDMETIENQITALADQIRSAEEEMTNATNSMDVTKYKEAKLRLEDASITMEMYQTRKADLIRRNGNPLISKDEYEQDLKAIYGEMALLQESAEEKLYALSNDMAKIASDLEADQRKANEVLSTLQDGVYKGADRNADANGRRMRTPLTDQRVKCDRAIHWGRKAVESPQYKDYSAEREDLT